MSQIPRGPEGCVSTLLRKPTLSCVSDLLPLGVLPLADGERGWRNNSRRDAEPRKPLPHKDSPPAPDLNIEKLREVPPHSTLPKAWNLLFLPSERSFCSLPTPRPEDVPPSVPPARDGEAHPRFYPAHPPLSPPPTRSPSPRQKVLWQSSFCRTKQPVPGEAVPGAEGVGGSTEIPLRFWTLTSHLERPRFGVASQRNKGCFSPALGPGGLQKKRQLFFLSRLRLSQLSGTSLPLPGLSAPGYGWGKIWRALWCFPRTLKLSAWPSSSNSTPLPPTPTPPAQPPQPPFHVDQPGRG